MLNDANDLVIADQILPIAIRIEIGYDP